MAELEVADSVTVGGEQGAGHIGIGDADHHDVAVTDGLGTDRMG